MQSSWDEKTEMRVEDRRMTKETQKRVVTGSSSMRVEIDPEQCLCRGSCLDICPEVFEIKDDVAIVRFAEIPARFEAACREAAELCPTRAISVRETANVCTRHAK